MSSWSSCSECLPSPLLRVLVAPLCFLLTVRSVDKFVISVSVDDAFSLRVTRVHGVSHWSTACCSSRHFVPAAENSFEHVASMSPCCQLDRGTCEATLFFSDLELARDDGLGWTPTSLQLFGCSPMKRVLTSNTSWKLTS